MSPFYILDFSRFLSISRWLSAVRTACHAGRHRTQERSSIPGWGISLREKRQPLQYFSWRVWKEEPEQATVQGVTRSDAAEATWASAPLFFLGYVVCKYVLPSGSFLFHFVDCFLCHAEPFRLMWSHLFIFIFIPCVGYCNCKYFMKTKVSELFPGFSMVWLCCRSLIFSRCFEWYKIEVQFHSFHLSIIFSPVPIFLLTRLSFLHWVCWFPSQTLTILMHDLPWACSVPSRSMSLLLCLYHAVPITVFVLIVWH